MSIQAENNKELVRRFVEQAQTRHDLSAIETYVAPDFVDHSAPPGVPTTREGVKVQFQMFIQALPDLHAIIDFQVADDDRVVTRKTLRGTHQGDLMGIPPTGRTVDIDVIDIVRVKAGRITEHWNNVDRLGLMRQLGVLG